MTVKINNKIIKITDKAGNPIKESDFLPIEVLADWTREAFERYEKIKKNEQEKGK